jgi:hypothetical protein
VSNRLDDFLISLESALPSLGVSVDRHPGVEDLAAWIDLSRGELSVSVEYLPDRGFGLHLDDDPDAFGSGPNETFTTHPELINRLLQIF